MLFLHLQVHAALQSIPNILETAVPNRLQVPMKDSPKYIRDLNSESIQLHVSLKHGTPDL